MTTLVAPPCPYSTTDLLNVQSQWRRMLDLARERPLWWVWTDEGYDLQDVGDPAVHLPWNEPSILPLRGPSRTADAVIAGNATEARFTWTPYGTSELVTVSRLAHHTAGEILDGLSGQREMAVYQRNRFVRRWTVVRVTGRYEPAWLADDPRLNIVAWLRMVASEWRSPERLVPFGGFSCGHWPALRPITEGQIPPVM